MRKMITKIKTKNLSNYLAAFAMIFAVVGGNSVCTFIFHDPEKPDLTQFRKF